MNNNSSPLVAIRCITYNHEPYLRDCLDGFVMQETNFPFVAIVHDDASTDATASIIREYAEKYPDIIKPIYETENQYSKGDGSLGRIMNAAIDATEAKYIAICEGDDYWTDPLKLQKQVDFLEANLQYSMCCHTVHYEKDGEIISDNKIYYTDTLLPIQDIIKNGGLYIAFASIVYRRNLANEYPIWRQMADIGDYPLYILLALKGNIHYFSDIMGVYRCQHPGSWTLSMKNTDKNIIHRNIECKWMELLDEATNYQYTKAIHYHLWKYYRFLLKHNKTTITSYIRSAIKSSDRSAIECVLKDFVLVIIKPYRIFKRILKCPNF